ncbi:hypothetical protein GBF38_008356 [Nibea albiflora]|uniref:Uncharacterized protein n=1 Tax=Nibea albiflora TaxID=240163 RepID=A0ACB7EZW1_NIBAL|nr:hypothetical protein GBF38_008356 [Nibea albiflora]
MTAAVPLDRGQETTIRTDQQTQTGVITRGKGRQNRQEHPEIKELEDGEHVAPPVLPEPPKERRGNRGRQTVSEPRAEGGQPAGDVSLAGPPPREITRQTQVPLGPIEDDPFAAYPWEKEGVEGETDGNTAEGEKRVQQDQSTETGQQQEKEQGRTKAVGRRRGAVLREEECNFLLEIEEDSLESRQKGTQKGTDKQKKGVTKERREKPDMVSIGVGPETPKPQRAPRATLVAKLLDREVMAVPPDQEKEGGTSHIMDSRLSLECTPPLIPTAAQQHIAQVHQADEQSRGSMESLGRQFSEETV